MIIYDDDIILTGERIITVESETSVTKYIVFTATSVSDSSTIITTINPIGDLNYKVDVVHCIYDTSLNTYAIRIKCPFLYTSNPDEIYRVLNVDGVIYTEDMKHKTNVHEMFTITGCLSLPVSFNIIDSVTHELITDNSVEIRVNGYTMINIKSSGSQYKYSIALPFTDTNRDFSLSIYCNGYVTNESIYTYNTLNETNIGIARDVEDTIFYLSGGTEARLPIIAITPAITDSYRYTAIGLYVSKDVELVYPFSFYDFSELSSVTVSNDNRFFDSRNNCNAIIGKNNNTLYAGFKTTVIPNTTTYIAADAFYGRPGLTDISIPDTVTGVGDYAFGSCDDLTGVTIGSGLTYIGSFMFYYCTSLSSITIPNNILNIYDNAFNGCYELTGITIPDSVITIGEYAFESCISIEKLSIGSGVTRIGNFAFDDAQSPLSMLACHAETPPQIEEFTFNYDAVLYVPSNSVNDYEQAEYWQWFIDIRPIT